jgi:hypothetical protein
MFQAVKENFEVEESPQSTVTTGDGGEPPLTKAEIRKFKKLCAQIKDDVHLQAILNTVPLDRRRFTYDQFVPFLTFAAKPFEQLRFF